MLNEGVSETESKIRTRILDAMIAEYLFSKAAHGASYHSNLLRIMLAVIGRTPTTQLLFIFSFIS